MSRNILPECFTQPELRLNTIASLHKCVAESAMIYALNVFNLVPGKEDDYRDYSVRAGKIIYRLGGKVVSAGSGPLRELHGDCTRRQMIVVEFPSLEVFEQFIDEAETQNIHALRENSTADYIWTLYEPWDMRTWVKSQQS